MLITVNMANMAKMYDQQFLPHFTYLMISEKTKDLSSYEYRETFRLKEKHLRYSTLFLIITHSLKTSTLFPNIIN